MVGLGAVRVLVGPEPERLHGRHPHLPRSAHVLVEPVADEERPLRPNVKGRERVLNGFELAQRDLEIRGPGQFLGQEQSGLADQLHVVDLMDIDPRLLEDVGSEVDRIMAAGGFISAVTGSAPDGNAIPAPKQDSDLAMDAAACIGCGACVAACKNASAMLFVAAKVSHLNILPQGKPEKDKRALAMVEQMDKEGFGSCTVTGSCEAVCPKGISLNFIARMNRDYFAAMVRAGK